VAIRSFSVVIAALICVLSGGPDRSEPARLVTRGPDGRAAQGRSGMHGLDLSARGDRLVFESDAGDLVPGDRNRQPDVFLHDTETGAIRRLSEGPDGTDADGPSRDPHLSADGTWVAYTTHARNLLPGKSTALGDIVLHDIAGGHAALISRGADGSEGTGTSSLPDLSDDGSFIVYQSWSDNLVSGDTNAACDIFLFDRTTGTTTRMSMTPAGGEADGNSTHPAISGDGRFISFSSDATNLVFDDTNGVADLFVVNRETGTIERVNLGPDDCQADAFGGLFPESVLSQDGRFVAYVSLASNLVEIATPSLVEQIYLRDRKRGTTRRVSISSTGEAADDRCFCPTITADGRLIGFQSLARNLLGNDRDTVADAYVFDRRTRAVRVISSAQNTSGARGDCQRIVISPEGCTVAFSSRASDLVQGDENDASDVFLKSL
jgi:Tol biopolymer transport system component